MEAVNIVLNRNAVPFDTNPPFYPSGIRLGTPGITSRGMKEKEMRKIAGWINKVIERTLEAKKKMGVGFEEVKKRTVREKIIGKISIINEVRKEIKELCKKFPVKEKY